MELEKLTRTQNFTNHFLMFCLENRTVMEKNFAMSLCFQHQAYWMMAF